MSTEAAMKQDNASPETSLEGKTASEAKPASQAKPAQVVWNDKEMVSHFANVVNIQSTKDQIDLLFGTNQTWNLSQENDVTIDLSSRIMLTPLVAKRLSQSLIKLLQEHEARHGALTE